VLLLRELYESKKQEILREIDSKKKKKKKALSHSKIPETLLYQRTRTKRQHPLQLQLKQMPLWTGPVKFLQKNLVKGPQKKHVRARKSQLARLPRIRNPT